MRAAIKVTRPWMAALSVYKLAPSHDMDNNQGCITTPPTYETSANDMRYSARTYRTKQNAIQDVTRIIYIHTVTAAFDFQYYSFYSDIPVTTTAIQYSCQSSDWQRHKAYKRSIKKQNHKTFRIFTSTADTICGNNLYFYTA